MKDELSLEEIDKTRHRLGDRVVTTPALHWQGSELQRAIVDDS